MNGWGMLASYFYKWNVINMKQMKSMWWKSNNIFIDIHNGENGDESKRKEGSMYRIIFMIDTQEKQDIYIYIYMNRYVNKIFCFCAIFSLHYSFFKCKETRVSFSFCWSFLMDVTFDNQHLESYCRRYVPTGYKTKQNKTKQTTN